MSRENAAGTLGEHADTVGTFLAHWDRAREEGRITARKANAVLSACRAVLATAGASLEHTPIAEFDIDVLCEHFERESEGKYKLNTVLTYVGRFRGALEHRHLRSLSRHSASSTAKPIPPPASNVITSTKAQRP